MIRLHRVHTAERHTKNLEELTHVKISVTVSSTDQRLCEAVKNSPSESEKVFKPRHTLKTSVEDTMSKMRYEMGMVPRVQVMNFDNSWTHSLSELQDGGWHGSRDEKLSRMPQVGEDAIAGLRDMKPPAGVPERSSTSCMCAGA